MFTQVFCFHKVSNLMLVGKSICHITSDSFALFLVKNRYELPFQVCKLTNY